MRKGFEPRLVFTRAGNLVAIATGSDACAEHEQGAKPLLNALASYSDEDDALVAALRAGKSVSYPSIFDKARISKQPAELQFVERLKGDVPEAILGLSRQVLDWSDRELDYGWNMRDEPQAVAGAWESSSFAVRVRGAKHVKALRSFYEDLWAGRCYFGGKFYEAPGGERLGGVVLVNGKFLGDDTKERVTKAQALYESNLRLKAKDDVAELHRELQAIFKSNAHLSSMNLGYFWVVWSNGPDSEIRYALNPGYRVKAQYWGPYTREQILDWARAGCSYELKPLR